MLRYSGGAALRLLHIRMENRERTRQTTHTSQEEATIPLQEVPLSLAGKFPIFMAILGHTHTP